MLYTVWLRAFLLCYVILHLRVLWSFSPLLFSSSPVDLRSVQDELAGHLAHRPDQVRDYEVENTTTTNRFSKTITPGLVKVS
jgi:hypothetical protein